MVAAICTELEMRNNEYDGTKVATIYFGGGTPSVLTSKQIQKILFTVFRNYDVIENAEITLEANPDDLNADKLKELEASPINRLSIGVQSFRESDLKLMNRAHNEIEAIECLKLAGFYFDNLSVDLIYGIPGLSEEDWKKNIQTAIDLNIPHISSYALTVEDKTPLKTFIDKGLIAPVEDELAQQHFDILLDMMGKNGYENYEFSNFGKPGCFSKNNTAYWTGKSYLGIGPSAHSYDGKRRGWNINNNVKYMNSIEAGDLPMEIEVLSTVDRYNEYIMTGLRTIYGVSLENIETEYGKTFKTYLLEQAEEYLRDHLLFLDGDTLQVTRKGKFLSDGIASALFMVNLS